MSVNNFKLTLNTYESIYGTYNKKSFLSLCLFVPSYLWRSKTDFDGAFTGN